MKLAFDLVTNLALHLAAHHWFEMVLTDGDTVLSQTRGRDTFGYNAMLLPGEPVCATGRTIRHESEPDLCGIRGVPGMLTEVELDGQTPFEALSLWVDTNLTFSQGELQTFYSLRCRGGQADATMALAEPVFRVHWEGQGLFRIFLAPLGGLMRP